MSDEQNPTGDNPGRGQPRGGDGRFVRSVLAAERDSLAARLRARGYSLREIAEKLQYSDESGAAKAISRAIAAVPVEDVAELRAIECARLDEISRRLWKVFDTKYPLIVPGHDLVQNGEYVEDPRHLLTVVDRLLRISERRAKLLGLDVTPPKREPEQPARPALESAGGHLELLRGLVALLAIEPADTRTLLALPEAVQAEAVPRER